MKNKITPQRRQKKGISEFFQSQVASGEQVSRALNIPRRSVCKWIHQLRAEGVLFEVFRSNSFETGKATWYLTGSREVCANQTKNDPAK